MGLIDLPSVAFPKLDPRLAPVLLMDGPCAGRYEKVPGNAAECWTRVGKPQHVGVETQMWSCYRRQPNGWFYTGTTVTTQQLQDGLRAARADGIEYGESYGV